MKKVVLLAGILVLFISLVSAGYDCSDGGLMKESQREIGIYERTSINELGLGLIYSDETTAFNRYSVRLITDAAKFTLTNVENSTEIELQSGVDIVSLTNLTDGKAYIKVDANTESTVVKEIVIINSRKVFLTVISGTYPGTATVEGIIGAGEISLNNTTPINIVAINGTSYLLELFSASDSNAIIKVKKCENASSNITFQGSFVGDVTVINETVAENNETVSNITEGISNETLNPEKNVGENSKAKGKTKGVIFVWIISLVFLFVILFLVIKLFKSLQRNQYQ